MRLAVVLVLGLPLLRGQDCAPSVLPPAGSITGLLDSESCRLSDDSAYAAYRIDLPVRGRLEVALSTGADLMLIFRSANGRKVDSGAAIDRPVETGTYTLLVNGRTPGQLGSYSLTTKFTPEPGLFCSNFLGIGVSQTVAGTLGASGCRMPNGAAYEAYVLNTFGAGTLTVTAASTEFSPVVIVRDGDGALVSTGTSSVVEVNAASRYQVVVYSSGGSGTYRIATSFEPDEDETCRVRKTLAEPDNDSAAIGVNSCITANPASADLAYFNYYDLKISTAGVADIVAASGDFLPTLNLLDDSGNLIATDSGSGGSTTSRIRMSLRPGQYALQVISTIIFGGNYQLTYGFTAGPPRPCRPLTGSFTETLAGRIDKSSCRTNLGAADLYGFTLASPGTLDLSLATYQFTSLLELRDSKDNLMIPDEDRQGLGESHVSADLPAGSYTVAAAARYDSGDYQLTATFNAHEIPVCASLQTLDINGGYIQKLGARSCRDVNGQPVDFYEFTLPEDSVVAAVMTSSEIDGYLTLTDVSGNALRSDDNSYGYLDPLIVQFLPAGTYRLEARAAGSTAGGYYQVDLRSTAGPRPVFCAPKSKLEMGAAATGTIQFSGCPYRNAFADIYEFRVAETVSIDLQLKSSEFDAYLVLLDEWGNVVAEDDNGGGGADAHIVDTLAPGSYYVVAKPVADYYAAGAYTLSLTTAQ